MAEKSKFSANADTQIYNFLAENKQHQISDSELSEI